MKQTILFLITPILFIGIKVQAQEYKEFAPIGAEWYYTNTIADPVMYYEHYVSEKDTLIQGSICKVVYAYYRKMSLPFDTIIFKQEGGKVYHYFRENFHLLYDYEARKDDTVNFTFRWRMYKPIIPALEIEYDSIIPISFKIDTIYTTIIDGKEIRTFEASPFEEIFGLYSGGEKYIYMEKFGHPYVFMEIMVSVPIPDAYFTRQLRCYSDTEIRYITDWWRVYDLPCDNDKRINISTYKADATIIVYPNPFKSKITIDNDDITRVDLFDMQGKQIYSANTRSREHDLSFLKQGFYILKIISLNGAVFYRKVIKGGNDE